MLIQKVILIATALMMSGAAIAEEGGNSGGGGGFAVLCNNKGKTTAELADLWLARYGKGPFRKIGAQKIVKAAAGDTVGSLITKAILKAKMIDASYGNSLERMVKEIGKNIERISNEKIISDNDTNIISLPAGCTIEGVARFSDKEEYLTISKDIEARLSQVDKAALIVHEAIYRIKRLTSHDSTSYNTQLDVGILFAEGKLGGVDLSNIESPMYCSDGSESFVVGIQHIPEFPTYRALARWNFNSGGSFSLLPESRGVGMKFDPTGPAPADSKEVFLNHVKGGTLSQYISSGEFDPESKGRVNFKCQPAIQY